MGVRFLAGIPLFTSFALLSAAAPLLLGGQDLDRRVQAFLESHRGQWHDLNVPAEDGKALYDLVLKNKFTRALEIGTSTGHSGIWIAWALSKTGGRLTTIEIDEARHAQALANFKEAGLAGIIDARLGDAHTIVPALPGPFDFVFCDADKDWYKSYLIAVMPKLVIGGCFAAHNVGRGEYGWPTGAFLRYLETLTTMETSFEMNGAGLSISYKRAEK